MLARLRLIPSHDPASLAENILEIQTYLNQLNAALSITAAQVTGGTFGAGTFAFPALAVLKGYTVATLPVGVKGGLAYCTDLTAPTYLAALVGGGAVVGPVFYNGTAWVSI